MTQTCPIRCHARCRRHVAERTSSPPVAFGFDRINRVIRSKKALNTDEVSTRRDPKSKYHYRIAMFATDQNLKRKSTSLHTKRDIQPPWSPISCTSVNGSQVPKRVASKEKNGPIATSWCVWYALVFPERKPVQGRALFHHLFEGLQCRTAADAAKEACQLKKRPTARPVP